MGISIFLYGPQSLCNIWPPQSPYWIYLEKRESVIVSGWSLQMWRGTTGNNMVNYGTQHRLREFLWHLRSRA